MSETTDIKTVEVPAMLEHQGFYTIKINLYWVCPVCGGQRGEVNRGVSYDGSLRVGVDVWRNECGHVDKYNVVRKEAQQNGLNVRVAA